MIIDCFYTTLWYQMVNQSWKNKWKSAQVKLPFLGEVLPTNYIMLVFYADLPVLLFWLSLVKSHLCILNLLSKWHFSLGSCKTNKCESTVCNCPSFPCSTLTYHPVCNWNASTWLLSGANVTVNAIMPYYPMSAAYCTAMYRCFYTEWFSSYRVYKTIETIWSVFKPAKDKGTEKQSIG